MSIKKLFLSMLLFSILNSDTDLTIYYSYKKAFSVAKDENKSLFILFGKSNCQWCKKLKSKIVTDINITKRLEDEFIVLFLDKQKDIYPSNFEVKAVPDVFLVSPNEEIYTEILGYHKNSEDYLKWFDYVMIEREI
jgi:thioredoxin-related protein